MFNSFHSFFLLNALFLRLHPKTASIKDVIGAKPSPCPPH